MGCIAGQINVEFQEVSDERVVPHKASLGETMARRTIHARLHRHLSRGEHEQPSVTMAQPNVLSYGKDTSVYVQFSLTIQVVSSVLLSQLRITELQLLFLLLTCCSLSSFTNL